MKLQTIPTVIRALQALIELCAGNYSNQLSAVNGQVVEPINLIINFNPSTAEVPVSSTIQVVLFNTILSGALYFEGKVIDCFKIQSTGAIRSASRGNHTRESTFG